MTRDHRDPPRSSVCVIVSANAEWRVIERLFPDVSRCVSPFGQWFLTEVGPAARSVLFFHGGWGKIAAAAATQYVIQHSSPSLLINLGTCGGFEGAVERGTVILVERSLVYDIHQLMGDQAEHIAHYSTEIDLDWLRRPYPHSVQRSLMISADRDIAAEDVPRLRREFNAIVGDWESGSIAWVARRHGVKTLILRGVSDLVGESGGEAYGQIEFFERSTEAIMQRLVAQLPDWIEASILA